MKKNILLFLLFFILVSIDCVFKNLALTERFLYEGSLVKIIFVKNHGIAFGALGSVNQIIKLSAYSFLYAIFLAVSFVLITNAFNKKELWLIRIGTVFYGAGITGNFIDKFRYGYTIDFINLKTGFMRHLVFNSADIVQVVGIIICIFCIFKYKDKIWFMDNIRKFKIINPQFQYSVAKKLAFVAFSINTITGLSLMIILNIYAQGSDRELFYIIWLTITLATVAISHFIGLIYSQKICGPIFAIQKYIEQGENQARKDFKLRYNDYFQELEDLVPKLTEELESADEK